jgi:hypothetical protein
VNGICRLCLLLAELQESHIIPAFVFRWRKDTAPTPFMRTSREPNRRVQDGLKRHWLCRDCEQVLGAWEKQFASMIFYPITQKGGLRIRYAEWLLKFCVSISWRALLLADDENSFVEFSDAQRLAVTEALQVWRAFLRGGEPHPGRFEQHLLVFEGFSSYQGGPLPPNINRYALRSVEMDIGWTNDVGFTFVKMGPFAVVGFFYLSNPREWSGGKVHVRDGVIGPTRYVLPPTFYDYIIGRARKYGTISENLSDQQRAVADKATTDGIVKNKEKLLGSHWMKAMQQDVDLFGDDAFKVGWPRNSGSG